jgi:excisionase family DNA binding protein
MQALFTLAETAKILKVSKTKVYHERKAGRLNVIVFGFRCVRVTESEIKRYVRAAGVKPRPPHRAGAGTTEAVA